MRITLDRENGTPIYLQIVNQIRKQILSKELAAGYRLPPERQLAEQLDVNRTTVLNAYRELKSEGLIGSHVGRGTVVMASKDNNESIAARTHQPAWEYMFSEYASRLDGYDINSILRLVSRNDVISFAVGIASVEYRPAEAFSGVQEEFLDSKNNKALLVSPVEGFASLRETVAEYMRRRGCLCRASEIMMLSGSQQGIDFISRVLLNPGDIVVTEEPTFFPAVQSFRSVGARVIGVPMSEQGMEVEMLEQILQRYKVKLIYTMPNHHNPSGITMDRERRVKLLELANRYQVVVLEDDAYGELCFDGQPLPTLKSMDTEGFVVYLNTFSKTVYPGLRLGWIVGHKKLIQRISAARRIADLHTNCLSQLIIERFIKSGGIERHLTKICEAYKHRRDLMITALDRHAPSGLKWNKPAGGYYLWCKLPDGVSVIELTRRATERGVAGMPGNVFYLSPERGNEYIRLNYTFADKSDIEKGIKILCECIKDLMPGIKGVEMARSIELVPII